MKRRNWMGTLKKDIDRSLRAHILAASQHADDRRADRIKARTRKPRRASEVLKPKRTPPSIAEMQAWWKSRGGVLKSERKGNPMAKKKNRKRKKRNGMPSGLKKYWAKMRAKRAARIPRKVRRKSYALLKRAVAKNKVRNYRKRRSNPKRRRTVTRISRVSRITLPAMSPAATKKTIALIRRLAGNRRVRVK